VAFVRLSEKKDGDDDRTGTESMLRASMDEAEERVPDGVRGLRRAGEVVMLWFDVYIIEPVCTGLRFLHLAFIFVPVIFAVPFIWYGVRVMNRDNEREGTLLWYAILVNAMERAGPAFIKVWPCP
jgi:aarF domain-containing kinase